MTFQDNIDRAAEALADAGLPMPNLPKPTLSDYGQPEWNVFDSTIWTQAGAVYCRDVDNEEWEARPADVVAYAYALLAAASKALADAGPLMPNLPKPTLNDYGQPEWNVFDSTIWTQTGMVYCRDVDNTEWEARPADVVAYAYALLAAASKALEEQA